MTDYCATFNEAVGDTGSNVSTPTTKANAVANLLHRIDLDDASYDDEHVWVRVGDIRALLNNVDLGG